MVQRTVPGTPVTLAEAALNSLAEAVLCLDASGRITYANTAAERLTGCARANSAGRLYTDLVKPSSTAGAGTLFHRDGQAIAVDTVSAPMLNERGGVVGTVVTLRNASSALEESRQLLYHAHHDALTGLPNRLLLNDRLTAAIAAAEATGEGLAVCFLDVDGLKNVNDVFGHKAGDQVLTTTASRLAASVGPADTVARFGGDEFVVVLRGFSTRAEARRRAAALAQAVGDPHALDAHRVRVAASLGLAIFPDHGATADSLIANADAAMYAAKRAGCGYREAGVDVARQAGALLRAAPTAFVARRRTSTQADVDTSLREQAV